MKLLIWIAVSLPALAISWGYLPDGSSFVLYREPKLVAAGLLGWVLLVALAWSGRYQKPRDALETVFKRPVIFVLAFFLAYMLSTGAWTQVSANYLYEANQYLLLFGLLLMGLVATQRNSSFVETASHSLLVSLGIVTAIGILQWFVEIPGLAPIDPEIGVAHPSLMGYKNPAALALVGQIFLLAERVTHRSRRLPVRIGWGILWILELAYLLSLRSRTSYLAFAGAGLVLLTLWLVRGSVRRAGRQALVATAAVCLACVLILSVQEPARKRLAATTSYLLEPASYLTSDRGTYLLNTLNMARHHPFGVGLGDWQTAYPLYRLRDRYRAFDDSFEVRRAHSDHVQFLGEGGWIGMSLWVAFLGTLLWTTATQSDRRQACFHSAQVAAFILAMATDYVLELPYSKYQFFWVLIIVLGSIKAQRIEADSFVAAGVGVGHAQGRVAADRRIRRPRWLHRSTVPLVVLSLVGLGEVCYHWALGSRIQTAARIESSYQSARSSAHPERNLRDIVALAPRLAKGPGHTKTLYRAWLTVGEAAHRLGQNELALAATGRALRLHPFSPTTLRSMARVTTDPEASAEWLRASEFVKDKAVDGPSDSYPDPHFLRDTIRFQSRR
ncbi:MAG: O-antigen ligase family protein [Thermoanaerobaculia bacterium]|nr:O-antigen ligase family protein [Thermoanaerobaculia bacterium]